jgi:hypothetical protein
VRSQKADAVVVAYRLGRQADPASELADAEQPVSRLVGC